MASKALMDKLNDAIAREIQVSVQYMWQHVTVKGINAEPLGDVFKKIAMQEMRHAEEIAERLHLLGGVPTTKSNPIEVGRNPREMLEIDKRAETEAVALYREIIGLAEKEGDHVTASLFIDILGEEEKHLHQFSILLES
jgi:bacterioferritin